MYLLAIKLDYNIYAFKNELHIPFFANDNADAENKADSFVNIWQDSVVKARLFKMEEIQNWTQDKEGK